MKNLGEQIYLHRTRCGFSQLDVAEELGVSRQSVSKWENGVATPELEKVVKLADLFDITLDELINDTIEMPKTQEKSLQAKSEPNVTQQIFAVLFMLLAFVAFFFYEPYISIWLFLPMFITGLLLLKTPPHARIICAWTWFLSLDAFFLQAGSPFRHSILLFLYFFLLLPLIIMTVASFRNQKFTLSRKARIFLAIGVPLMPALGAFSRFFVLTITLSDKFFSLRYFFAEILLVDLFLAAFLICLVPTFYTAIELIKKNCNRKNFDL